VGDADGFLSLAQEHGNASVTEVRDMLQKTFLALLLITGSGATAESAMLEGIGALERRQPTPSCIQL
jgi:hypothetical protein